MNIGPKLLIFEMPLYFVVIHLCVGLEDLKHSGVDSSGSLFLFPYRIRPYNRSRCTLPSCTTRRCGWGRRVGSRRSSPGGTLGQFPFLSKLQNYDRYFEKGLATKIIPLSQSRRFLYGRLRRKLGECRLSRQVEEVQPKGRRSIIIIESLIK